MQVILTAVYKKNTDEDLVLRKCECKPECEVRTPRKLGKVLGH